MKKYPWFIPLTTVCIFAGLSAACLRLDYDSPPPGLEIWRNNPGAADTEVKVLDLDPDEEAVVYLLNRGAPVQGNFTTASGSITVKKEGTEFSISGTAGAMGIVSFANRDGIRQGDLYIFVRNWKRADVYRHTLEPEPARYEFNLPESEDAHQWWTDPIARTGRIDASFTNRMHNSFAIYQLIIDRGFHYEAPDGLSSRNGTLHGDTVRESWKDLADGSHLGRKLHFQPHILYHPLGDYPYSPEDPSWKEEFLRKPVFAFVMHYDLDGDMVGGYADRQRLELKTMDGTTPPGQDGPRDVMYSLGGGDTFTHRWKFKLPANFRVSTEYTHIHQIKPEGADNGNPTFTLTCRKKSNGDEVMQLIYRGPIREVIGDREVPSVNWYPQEVPLAPFLGEWIRAEETVTYDSPGAYRIKLVRIRDMRVLLEWEYNPAVYDEEDPFVMFRKGNTYVRQKNGFYRRIMHMTPFGLPNPDDPVLEYYTEGDEVRLLFTDFEMDKWKD